MFAQFMIAFYTFQLIFVKFYVAKACYLVLLTYMLKLIFSKNKQLAKSKSYIDDPSYRVRKWNLPPPNCLIHSYVSSKEEANSAYALCTALRPWKGTIHILYLSKLQPRN